ncbi:HEAT repeat domain-containing protein [Azospirillum isscasi]|uniref:HEAT repeat domain-containing protein n=1 Tax=Azospirillum isscasi TaxID=3053926 RepID=A0ABU0WPD5_9PROT|nr:HEAT repeat domain-containing protein [Azospirillum isscasi]MDQ2106094.1 HEAT repeat domain-containing protein [Azospirillum isscasi]
MPLVKAPSGAAAPGGGPARNTPNRDAVLADLTADTPDTRRAAARACRAFPDAVALIAKRLEEEEDTRVVEALVLNLVAIGGPAAAAALAPLLRSDRAGCRFAAAEALADMGPDALPFFDALIRDSDPQVRIMAAEIARGRVGGAVVQTLEHLLGMEEEINVCCAFIDVLAETGTADTAAVLTAVLDRLPEDQFLRFSVETALSRLPTD